MVGPTGLFGACTGAATQPPVAQPDEHGERHRDEKQAEDQRRLRIGVQRDVRLHRDGPGGAGEVAGERDGGTELAKRSLAHANTVPAISAARTAGKVTRRNAYPLDAPRVRAA